MFDSKPKVKLDPNWQPPKDWTKVLKKKQRGALRHISLIDEADGTIGDRVRLHLNEVLSEKEKGLFSRLMYERHLEWFGCACWGSNGSNLTVRISIKKNQHLADARIEVGKHADEVLDEVLASRQKE